MVDYGFRRAINGLGSALEFPNKQTYEGTTGESIENPIVISDDEDGQDEDRLMDN
jgi:hypothetical protein